MKVRRAVAAASGVVIALCLALYFWPFHAHDLPYSDSFAKRSVSEWIPTGGSWHLDGDAIMVSASESGATLKTGSDEWTDYEMSTDVVLRGHGGFVGLAVRVSNSDADPDSIRGYIIHLRAVDSGLEIIRSSNASLSVAPVHLHGGVNPNTWYRLRVIVVGCRIAAQAVNLSTGATAYSGFEDSPSECIRGGKAELRTSAAAAGWRRIQIEKATAADLEEVWRHVQKKLKPSYPIRERELTAMRQAYLADVPPSELHRPTNLGSWGSPVDTDKAELVRIDDLRTRLWDTKEVRVAGVVTSTSPLFVQDATSGISLATSLPITLEVGDEIEVLGHPKQNDSRLQFLASSGRFLSDRVPIIPLSVTPTQAASGRYEGSLIELNGVVRSSQALPSGALDVKLEDGTQRFTVRVPYDLFNSRSLRLDANSRLRVRGVCSTDDSAGPHYGAFILYATSSADVVLLAGPPWWSGQRLIWLLCGCFLVIVTGIIVYGMEESARFRIVQGERERLSHDMHDTLAQTLAGVGFRLQGILRSLQDSPNIPKVHIDDLRSTCELVARSHREASSNIAALHPASEKEGDVLALLEKAIYSMLDDEEFPVIVSSYGTPRQMSPVVRDTLFRVGREAVANALRHSQARSIKVQLHYYSREVVLSVTDDGIGFQFDPLRAGFGIKSMIRRCDAIKATIRFTSPEGGGCRVQIASRYRVHRGLIRWVG